MLVKKYALMALMLLATVGLADQTYIVKKGDTLSSIANKAGVSVGQLKSANSLSNVHSLRLGQTLKVPSKNRNQVSQNSSRSTSAKTSGGYTVREGDNDWVIAARLGIKTKDLHALNPGIKWSRLQIGQTLKTGKTAPKVARSIPFRSGVISGEGIALRSTASTSSTKVASLKKSDRITVQYKEGDWFNVKTSDGKKGWVRQDFVKAYQAPKVVAAKAPKTPVASRNSRGTRVASLGVASTDNLMDHAFSMRGTRYRWGGTSRAGVDCSGFTTNVFRSQGISLPRTSRDQSRIGQYVAKSELKEGDLVFFKTARKSYINHVGIYAGDGKFIHSSSSQGNVRVDRLDSGYSPRQFVTARRVVNSKPSKPIVAKKTPTEVETSDGSISIAVSDEKPAPAPPKPVAKPGLDEIGK